MSLHQRNLTIESQLELLFAALSEINLKSISIAKEKYETLLDDYDDVEIKISNLKKLLEECFSLLEEVKKKVK